MSEIRDFVMAEPLFDNHEHQNGFDAVERAKDGLDYSAFLGYAPADVATASPDGTPSTRDPKAFFDAWQSVRTTGYGQATELACDALLGLEFTAENADAITRALQAYVADRDGRAIYAGVYELANVGWAICDECWDSPTKLHYFTGEQHPAHWGHALRYDAIIAMSTRTDLAPLERALDRSIQRLDELDDALDAYADRAAKGGKLRAMKCGMAYQGRLEFPNSSFAEAERVFEAIMQGRPVDRQPLTGYLLHRFVQRARDFRVPIQFHTGYLAGNWGDPTQGDPRGLVPIFQRYRDVRFDLFHAAWPFHDLLGAIGKVMPNVYLDLCWAWSMAPDTMERTLSEWLSQVPHNKLFAFGADTGTPYPVPGYALQARRGVANVLERKVERGDYDLPTATRVARRILHENARELFGMS